jgi:hypothetical protein
MMWSWGTKPIRAAVPLATASPSCSTAPAEGGRSPAMVSSSVVLPAPLPPTRATNSPGATENDLVQELPASCVAGHGEQVHGHAGGHGVVGRYPWIAGSEVDRVGHEPIVRDPGSAVMKTLGRNRGDRYVQAHNQAGTPGRDGVDLDRGVQRDPGAPGQRQV